MREQSEGEKNDLRQFEENPYNPEKSRPEDLVRIFYTSDQPFIPVVSRRGHLFGILMKNAVVSELSDIDRTRDQKIDQFINRLAKKMTLDEIIPHTLAVKEFVIINIFGEVQGKWSRIDLFNACESTPPKHSVSQDIDRQKEMQILEWMIYLILEHIPRAVYAVNQIGKTIFYNHHFEDLIRSKTKEDINIDFVEDSLKNPDKNEFFYRKKRGKEIYFYNKDMDFYYERVPLVSTRKNVGYLIYCAKELNEKKTSWMPAIDVQGMKLKDILEAVERGVLVDSIKKHEAELKDVSKELSVSQQLLKNRIKKLGIDLKPKRKARTKK